MGRLFWVVAVVPLALPTCVSAESLYLTTKGRLEKLGFNDSYTFIAPYVTGVETQLSISLTKDCVLLRVFDGLAEFWRARVLTGQS